MERTAARVSSSKSFSGSNRRIRQAEIVRDSRADDHTEDEYRGIAVTFSTKKQLPAGASSRQAECEACQGHAGKVPDMKGMDHGLVFKSHFELAQDAIGEESEDQKRKKTAK